MQVRFQLPPRGSLEPNSPADPLPFYYRPLVGRLYIARIDLGLRLLEPGHERLLEIGYGSGLLLPTLQQLARRVFAVDLRPPPKSLPAALERLGAHPSLVQADIRALPFATGSFDAVVAFSILEHLHHHELAPAAAELARVLAPGGVLVIGCPAVHPPMNALFTAIGFPNIGAHHHSSLRDIVRALETCLVVERHTALPPLPLPLGWAPYGAVRLKKGG